MESIDISRNGGRIFLLVLIVLAFTLVSAGCSSPEYPGAFGGEKRDTMSPGHFIGKTGRAYKSAKDNPDLLDKIYCYCKCQDNFGHKSLLTCFVDRHGSQCGVCMDEALMADDLRKKGYGDEEIVEKINAKFSKEKH
ncbi:MAG: CYCXC family (seleno)protein [bacterium]|nr:CYCXC family (seleno)protein [bacterium]